MTVIVLTNCPAGLRGFLTRWMLEISAGVFVGNPSARIRDVLWAEIQQYARHGRALLAHTTNNEQGFTFRTHDHAWHPADHEGITLIRRPDPNAPPPLRLPETDHPRAGAGPPNADGWERLMHTGSHLSHLPESEKVLGNRPQRP